MEPSVNHEPLNYTSKMPKSGVVLNKVLMIIFGSIAIGLILAGIYWIFLDGDYWIASCFAIPIGVVMAWLSSVAYKSVERDSSYEYQFDLDDKGIHEKRIYKQKNRTEENHIPFEDMDKVLIGNFAHDQINPNGRNFFTFGAIVVIMYKGKYFLKRIMRANELDIWISRFNDKNRPIFYTEYDLTQALLDSKSYDIEFDKIEGIPWNQIDHGDQHKPMIGYEDFFNPFPMWELKEITEKKNKEKRKKTRKMDAYVTGAIFIYALFMSLVLLPNVPITNEGYVIMNLDSILYDVFPAFLPLIFVAWRRYYKWFMPLVYYISATLGAWLGLFVTSAITGREAYYMDIAEHNTGIFYIWFGGLFIILVMKLFMFVRDKYRNRKRNRFTI